MNDRVELAYANEELERLHAVLLDILKEIIRVCTLLDIEFFTIGGTAIGAKYYEGFVPCDDDIDLGMSRDNYNRFIKEAPGVFKPGYFLQHPNTEPKTPFYFTKIRKDNTLFVQEKYKDMDIHHGIFIDIFPFDRVPDNPLVSKIHRRIVQFLEGSFNRRQVKSAVIESQPNWPAFISKPMIELRWRLIRLIPRHFFIWRLNLVSSAFDKRKTSYWDVIKSSVDKISDESISHLLIACFEGLEIKIPGDIDNYLKNHYPGLQSKEQIIPLWKSHAPFKLSFEKGLTCHS